MLHKLNTVAVNDDNDEKAAADDDDDDCKPTNKFKQTGLRICYKKTARPHSFTHSNTQKIEMKISGSTSETQTKIIINFTIALID